MSSSFSDVPAYKGKVTNRSWAQLPEEIVRIIGTYFIWDLSVANYCPEQWGLRPFWQNRMVYTALRDGQDVERFMRICPSWGAAMETHMFWLHAIALIDPHDTLGAHAWVRTSNSNSSAPPLKMSPYQHFRNITRFSCYVCRINHPNSNVGLGNAKGAVFTPYLSFTGLCRDHEKPRNAYCGLCLREGQSYEVEMQANQAFLTGCIENEDREMWPNTEATCKCCRAEWLWRQACINNVRDAVGGRRFRLEDWEAKSTIDGFVDLGEGRISDILIIARERHWIRTHTKLSDMLSQALAASRFDGQEERLVAAAQGEDVEMDLSEEEDEDYELAQITEDNGIRELALGDWVRNRILDGFWISPADQWYHYVQPEHPWDVRAVHPCPWTVEDDEARSHAGSEQGNRTVDEEHPRPVTVREAIPPSRPLCEQSYHAHQKQMRTLLLPAMKNIVRRLVIECGADGVDPAIRATRMTFEDVMKELRDEATWFEGVDWLERRRNARREAAAREEASSDDHSTSSGSSKSSDELSILPSPVLSSTTLQTTPSPPPIEDKNGTDVKRPESSMTVSPAVTIAVSPVLDPPRLIHPIPHVPIMAAHLPFFSNEAFKSVWREACSPLYHCRCGICIRAQAQANEAAAVPNAVNNQTQDVPAEVPANVKEKQQEIVEIKLGEPDGEGEEEIDYLEYEEDDSWDSEGLDADADADVDSRYDSRSRSRSPPRLNRTVYHAPPVPISPRKRSCDEIDEGRIRGRGDDDDDDRNTQRERADEDTTVTSATLYPRIPGTPPKRIRRDGPPALKGLTVDDPSKRMMHKRSSEALIDEDMDHDNGNRNTDTRARGRGKNDSQISSKRAKMSEEAESPPTSLTAEDSEHSSADVEVDEGEEYRPGRRIPIVEQ
ncbi:hypothetical protein BDP27DRAFT_1417171 [Rhodocollybia butyracea]|uniref:Uncharacterized protein n=1 Tax=Rhodocollybia butyracea TaxID=206335 RepID=A0A9P5UBR3_9AGAR|nr:hypothetical protein BDP27DRAFT_1417171 [Rhodocollybia butyracea]